MTKVFLLAGGKGSRLNENLPKPLVSIGSTPIIVHLMNYYSQYGYSDFYLLTGYKHYEFEKYFYNWEVCAEYPYSVTLIDTGENTNTGERISHIEEYSGNEHFCLSYGDGLTDVNLETIEKSFLQHENSDLLITTVHPPERYGIISTEDDSLEVSKITAFNEKPSREDWINAGFMVANRNIFKYIKKGDTFEQTCIPEMVKDNRVIAYKHKGNWGCIDTQKDLNNFNDLWNSKKAFWI